MILVTGSSGLIGRSIVKRLARSSIPVRTFDFHDNPAEDSRSSAALERAMQGVTGIIHLAAISRVVWAEQNPVLCQAVNVNPLREIIDIALRMEVRPWLIFASSREVYGESPSLPVSEDAPLSPLNVYARSKVAGEQLVHHASAAGLRASLVRFSNVYGCIHDHSDRVVPAFARTAAEGGVLRLEGADNLFDFTHIDDATDGLYRSVIATMGGEALPPIHFLTGSGTTLRRLAELAIECARAPVEIVLAPPRSYDVSRFVGNPERAMVQLGWQPRTGIERGMKDLVDRFAMGELVGASVPFIDGMTGSAGLGSGVR